MIIRIRKLYVIVALVLIFSITFISVFKFFSRAEGADKNSLVIIMYHNLTIERTRFNAYAIHPDQLEQDFRYLSDNGYTTIGINDLLNIADDNLQISKKSVMITFDDGHESFLKYAVPLLEKFNMKAVISIVGSYTDAYTQNEDHNTNYSHLNWKQVKELNDHPLVEIGNHTYDMHYNQNGKRHGSKKMYGETNEDYRKSLIEDIGNMQRKTTEVTGSEPTVFTYPFGQLSAEALPVIKELGFKAAFTCAERPNIIGESDDWLYKLGRYNRAYGKTSAQFFPKILK